MPILDTLAIKTLERTYNIAFTKEDLNEARDNDGHVWVQQNGRFYHFQIPILKFPNDLISTLDQHDEK